MNSHQRRKKRREIARQFPAGSPVLWNPYRRGPHRPGPTSADRAGEVMAAVRPSYTHVLVRLYARPAGRWLPSTQLRLQSEDQP